MEKKVVVIDGVEYIKKTDIPTQEVKKVSGKYFIVRTYSAGKKNNNKIH